MPMTVAKPSKAKSAPTKTSKNLDPTKPKENMVDFFKSVYDELFKISWPTVPQIWVNTVIVIAVSVSVSLGMWAVDNIFRGLIWVLTQQLPSMILP